MNDSRYIIQTKTLDGIEGPQVINRARFARLIADYFDGEEINSLAFNLPLDKENIPGNTKIAVAEALVEKCANRGFLQELWELCKKGRPNVTWGNALEPPLSPPIKPPPDFPPIAKQPKGKLRNLWLAVGWLIAVSVLIGTGWFVGRNGRASSTSELDDGLVFDFEEQSELINWVIKLENETMMPERTQKVSLSGRYALELNATLTAPNLRDGQQKAPVPQILLDTKDLNLEHKIIIYRVYAPADAPDNLAAQLFLLTNDGKIWGDYTHLTPGGWATLSWASGLAASEIGIEIKMDDVLSDRSSPTYMGDIYIDRVEILEINYPTDIYHDPSTQAVTSGVLYSFEDEEISSQWVPRDNATKIYPSPDYAFEGRYALAIDANLTSRESSNDMSGTATLVLMNPSEIVGQVAIFRVFIPENAPTNLLGQMFLDYDGPGIWGDYQSLEPGKWTTLVWSTADAPPWDPPANIGLHVILEQPDQNADTDAPEFTGTFYVDMVELLPLPVRYPSLKDPTSLDANLEPALFFDFDSGAEGITLFGQANNAEPIWITEPNEGNVLEVDVNIDPYSRTVTYDNVAGGICLSSDDTSEIQAVRAYVYASEGADLTANITANGEVSGQSASFFGGNRAIQPGEWNLLYWSTANLQYCLDGEQDQCASVRTSNENICISVTTDNIDGYEGFIYFDDIGLYRISE